jgi:hypothetical protein
MGVDVKLQEIVSASSSKAILAKSMNIKFKKDGNNKVDVLQIETYAGLQSANKEK